MAINTQRFKYAFYILALIIFTVLCHSSVCLADDSDMNVKIKQIRRSPVFDSGEVNVNDAVDRKFKVKGPLHYVDDERIVVNDQSYRFAPGVGVTGISLGTYVGIRFNNDRQVIECRRLQRPR